MVIKQQATSVQNKKVVLENFDMISNILKGGLDRELNPGPLAPEARIIPLDHQAMRWLEMRHQFGFWSLLLWSKFCS